MVSNVLVNVSTNIHRRHHCPNNYRGTQNHQLLKIWLKTFFLEWSAFGFTCCSTCDCAILVFASRLVLSARISSTVFLCLYCFAGRFSFHTSPFLSFLSLILAKRLVASTFAMKAAVSFFACSRSMRIFCFLTACSCVSFSVKCLHRNLWWILTIRNMNVPF